MNVKRKSDFLSVTLRPILIKNRSIICLETATETEDRMIGRSWDMDEFRVEVRNTNFFFTSKPCVTFPFPIPISTPQSDLILSPNNFPHSETFPLPILIPHSNSIAIVNLQTLSLSFSYRSVRFYLFFNTLLMLFPYP